MPEQDKPNDKAGEGQLIDTTPKPADKTVDDKGIEKPIIKHEDKPADKPIEVADDKTISFDDFKDVLGEATSELEVKDPSGRIADKKEDKPVDDKTKLDTKPDDKQKADDKSVDDKGKSGDARDYSNIPDNVVPLFKKMGNESFAHFKPIFLEHQALKKQTETQAAEITKLKAGTIPDSYFEHPRGYTLTPEFEKTADTVIKAGQIVDHWNGQLEKIKSGADTYQEVHVDNKGNLYLSKPIKADKDSEDTISGYIKGCQNQLNRFQGELQNLSTSHGAKVQEQVKATKDFETAAFQQFKQENAKDWEPIVKDIITKSMVPAYHNHPLASVVAKSLLTIQQLGGLVKILQEKIDKGGKADPKAATNGNDKHVDDADKNKLNPTNSDMSGGGAARKAGDVTMDDFKEYEHSR